MYFVFAILAVPEAQAMPGTPKGMMETGAPSFVVLGPEALGLSSSPIDIKRLPDGRILVVSQKEFAFGDGVRWETYHALTDDATSLSSVAVDSDGTIYTGIDNGFAQVHLVTDSHWQLQRVVTLGKEIDTQDAALVSVTRLHDNWYWYGGNGSIVSWRPGRAPHKVGKMGGIERIFSIGDRNYVSYESSGALFQLEADGSASQLRSAGALVSSGITCTTPYSKDALLVGTGSAGFKLFDGGQMRPFGKGGLPGKGLRITDVCAAGPDHFAASIDSLGIIFFDREGNLVQVLERTLDHRLARVRHLVYSNNGVLWALLNDGIARVQFPSPVSNFEPLIPSGLKFAKPLRHDGSLWLIADGRALRGVYDSAGHLERFVDDSPPGNYLFTLKEVAGTLYGANDRGIYAREASGWRDVLPGVTNARVGFAMTRDGGVGYVARGEYGIIRRNGDAFTALRVPMPELGDSYGAATDAKGIGWLELGYSLVGRFDPAGAKPVFETLGPGAGLSTSGWVEIYTLDGIARFHVSGHLYRFDTEHHAFMEDRELLDRMPRMARATGRPVADPSGRLWLTLDGVMRVIDPTSPDDAFADITPLAFSPTNYTMQDDGVVWMFQRGHLARFDPRFASSPRVPIRAIITSVHMSASSRDIISPGPRLKPIPYSDNSLVFGFAAPANPFTSPVRFEVQLEGAGDHWVSTGTTGTAVFNRLKEDKYTFRVRPVVNGTVQGEGASVAFRITPPWFRTPLAWSAYFVSAAALLGFVAWFPSFLQRREKQRLALLVSQRTGELSSTNARLERQIDETTAKSAALAASEERYRTLNAELEDRVRQRTVELEQVHKQLLDTSRKAGMAEVATGVLHNVGNVLNSVNVSANLVRETLHQSEMTSLERVAGLLREHNGHVGEYISSDPKGRLLPGFVIQLSEQLSKEHKVVRTETEQLSRNIEHIKGIVAMQQSYATVSGVQEEVSLADLVRDAAHMHSSGLRRHDIQLNLELADLPLVIIDKHKVLQILVNLIKNAKHAISDAARTDGRIEAKLAAAGHDRAIISISDNGVGIPAGNLVKIFSHGFTTRAGGHGFGLHSGALAAREIGGTLRVESAGAGQGATFILEIPIAATKAVE